MSDPKFQALERLLRERRSVLEAEVRALHTRTEDEPFRRVAGEVGDSGDESTASTLLDTEHAEIGRDVHELRAIDAALERIASGDYGRCSDCDEAIAPERLDAYPTAERCIRCQELFERTHAQERHSRL